MCLPAMIRSYVVIQRTVTADFSNGTQHSNHPNSLPVLLPEVTKPLLGSNISHCKLIHGLIDLLHLSHEIN